MMYAVLHCRKIKTAGGLAAVAKHNSREGIYDATGRPIGANRYGLPDWITRPDRKALNALNQQDAVPNERLFRRRSQRISGLPRKPRKDAAHAVEAIYTASAEWFEGKSTTEIESFFEDCLRWNETHFGAQNTLHWAIHYDEKTPHMHVLMTPITQLKRENGKLVMGDKERYSSADFLGGRDGLRKIQSEFAEEVGERHGLERGVEGSTARHDDQIGWAKALSRREKALAELEPEKEKFEHDKSLFEQKAQTLLAAEKEFNAAIRDVKLNVANWIEDEAEKLKQLAKSQKKGLEISESDKDRIVKALTLAGQNTDMDFSTRAAYRDLRDAISARWNSTQQHLSTREIDQQKNQYKQKLNRGRDSDRGMEW